MSRYVLIGFTAVLVLVLAAGVYVLLTPDALDQFRSVEKVTETTQVNEMALAFVGGPYPDDYGVLRVPGWIDNLSAQEMKNARLQIQLIDEDGVRREKITHDVSDIPPMSRKTFDINAGTVGASRDATISVVWVEVYQ